MLATYFPGRHRMPSRFELSRGARARACCHEHDGEEGVKATAYCGHDDVNRFDTCLTVPLKFYEGCITT